MSSLPDSIDGLTSVLFERARSEDVGWIDDDKTRKQIIDLIESENDPDLRQRMFNILFPTSNRELAVSKASEDTKGRKVRYYRSMNLEKFLKLMEEGVWSDQTISDDEIVNTEELLVYLYNLTRWTRSFIDLDSLTVDNIKDHLKETFPTATEEAIQNLLAAKKYSEVRSFLSSFADKNALKSMHRASSSKFNPYFSCSVGGPAYSYGEGLVCLEMVIPDDRVEADKNAFEEEKEVYLRGLDLSWITRVYGEGEEGNQQWIDEVIYNPELPIGEHTRDKFNPDSDYSEISSWTRGEKTEDCLPVGLKNW